MSIKKILIGIGDSYTNNDNRKSWVEKLCAIGEFDSYVKVAKGGASNDWIFNSAYDIINEYGNDSNIELTVIVLWSDAQRINFFDTANRPLLPESFLTSKNFYLPQIDIEDYSLLSQIIMDACKKDLVEIKEPSPEKLYSNILTYTYRKLYLLEEYCHLRNIKLYHGCIFGLVSGKNIIENIARSFTINDLPNLEPSSFMKYKTELENSKSFMGFDFRIYDYIMEMGLVISKENTHPNEEGHRHIAELIYKFMNDGIRPELKDNTQHESDFIYD
jgi:hypothetical protein